MDEQKELKNTETIPVGVLNMMLVKLNEANQTLAESNKRMYRICLALAFCWLCTIGGVFCYLSMYEVQVTNFGAIEQSKFNTSTGQFNEKVDTFTVVNNNGAKGNDNQE